MKVKSIINQLEKVLEILKEYEDDTIENCINDIHSKVLGGKKTKSNRSKNDKVDINFEEILHKLKKCEDEEEALTLLEKFKKNELIEFGLFVDIGVDKRENKSMIARRIFGHINFFNLNEKIADRPKHKQ